MSEWPSTRARQVLAALLRIGWRVKRTSGSHRTLSRDQWADFVLAFHAETTMPRATTTKSKRSPAKSSRRGSSHTRTVVYDVAKQLRTPKEMAAYLEAWLVEAPDDAAGIARALGDIARAVGMSKVAKQSGLSRESLYKALSEDGNPSLDTILRVARAVGVRFRASAA